MINTNDLRHEISTVIGHLIPENQWRQTFNELNAVGQPDFKTLSKMVVILLEHVEKLEQK